MDMLGAGYREAGPPVTIFFWEINQYTDRLSSKSDLIILCLSHLSYYLLKPALTFRMPHSVRSVMNLPGSLEAVQKRFSKNALRKVQKCSAPGCSVEVHCDESWLNHFYYKMYLPYIQKRFSRLAETESYFKARRLFRTGFLLTVRKKDRLLAGAICRIRKGVLIFELVGVEKGDPKLLNEGALDLLYYHTVLLALDRKCSAVNFGISRPFLNDGLVQYKNKWGAALVSNPKLCRSAVFRLNTLNRHTHQLFSNNFPVILGSSGLSGLIISDRRDPLGVRDIRHLHKAYCVHGLDRLFVISPGGFTAEAQEHCGKRCRGRLTLIEPDSSPRRRPDEPGPLMLCKTFGKSA